MPFALITIGVVIFATALNGTFKQFGGQLYKDLFTNTPPFIYWAAALIVVGLIGYIPAVKKPADWFMFLIIIGIVLANGGFFNKLQQALQHPQGVNPVTTGNAQGVSASVPGIISSTGVNTTTQTNAAGLQSNPVPSTPVTLQDYQNFLTQNGV